MKRNNIIIAVILVIAAIVIVSSAYIVNETEQVIITQFGKPIGKPVVTPGIHFKIPIIQHANFFDRRFLEWDGAPNQIPTKDKRFIWVDTYARWRIEDPLLFFQRVRDERGAQSRLDDILDGETRNAIAKHNLVEIIRSTNRAPVIHEMMSENDSSPALQRIKYGREKITRDIIAVAAKRTRELGIELLDLRLKRVNYVEEVQKKIFERMITERNRIADKYRSEGHGEASKIIGDKERDLKKIQSEAYKKAQEITGQADAKATAIYAKAYNQSAQSREFYRFLKTMETYKTTLSEKDWLILSTKGDFFRYLQKQSGK
ncbi:modulator of FtsH protease HflC [bacterium BMS3Abin07]|nr:modulator of FtsH protease HflC [bacterium BMS3Abin07]GBE32731.1 modulator of FtsH protease HflC [bacterium BMS3Bbin05]HDL20273.1 protease modulator HflC [Nitrospirota bacterium]HDO21342.1 protease modulator HflC [Nitrospirota bacterium]HDZ87786.1 protease modulator HflC [Nitrospirota bacterium]